MTGAAIKELTAEEIEKQNERFPRAFRPTQKLEGRLGIETERRLQLQPVS